MSDFTMFFADKVAKTETTKYVASKRFLDGKKPI